MVDGPSGLRMGLGQPAFPDGRRGAGGRELNLSRGALSDLGEARAFLVDEVSAVRRAQIDLPHQHAGVHEATRRALAAHAQAGSRGPGSDTRNGLNGHRAGLGGALRLNLRGQWRSDLDVGGRAMLESSLLRAELKTGGSGAGDGQRGQGDLLVGGRDGSHILQSDVDVLSRDWASAHDKLLDLVARRLRGRRAGRRSEGRSRGLWQVGLLIFALAAGEGSRPLELALGVL